MTAPRDPWERVSAVVVTHHSEAVIAACLEAIDPSAEIIVVDNASEDRTCELATWTRPGARILRNRVGLGFGNAASRGLNTASREFALVINPDATLRPGALGLLIEAAERHSKAAVVAPLILNPDGSMEPSFDVPLFVRSRFVGSRPTVRPAGELCASYLSGAVMLLRRPVVGALGCFDPNIFLYYEDDDLCLRLARAGHSLVLVPAAEAMHLGGKSGRATWGKWWEKFWHMSWSRLYIERKYQGAPAMLQIAIPNLFRFGLKALVYAVTFNRRKFVRDAARACGTAAYLVGLPAVPRAAAERPSAAEAGAQRP